MQCQGNTNYSGIVYCINTLSPFLFRREVEEMEEKLQLAESDRQARQVAEEKELERRREILEKMHVEAEKMKKEAEMVRLRIISF